MIDVEDTLLEEAAAHGRASYLLTRAMVFVGLGIMLLEADGTGLTVGLPVVLIAAAIEQHRG